MVWADAVDRSRLVDSLLKAAGYESRIQDKGRRHHPLHTAAQDRNGEHAKTHAKGEHVFGQMEMALGGKLTCCMI